MGEPERVSVCLLMCVREVEKKKGAILLSWRGAKMIYRSINNNLYQTVIVLPKIIIFWFCFVLYSVKIPRLVFISIKILYYYDTYVIIKPMTSPL